MKDIKLYNFRIKHKIRLFMALRKANILKQAQEKLKEKFNKYLTCMIILKLRISVKKPPLRE